MNEEGYASSEEEASPEISSSGTSQPSNSDTQRSMPRQGLVVPTSLVEPHKAVHSCDIRNYLPQPSSSLSSQARFPRQGLAAIKSFGESSGSSSNGNGMATSQLQQIGEMFPFLDQETISKTLTDANMNVEVAIDKLLGSSTGATGIFAIYGPCLGVFSEKFGKKGRNIPR